MRQSNGSSKRRKTGASSTSNLKDKVNSDIKSVLEAGDKYAPPKTRLADLAGIDGCIEEVLQLIGMPLKHPEVYTHLGIQPPRGILLHGPPGCGKSMLANAIAGESQVPFIQISAPSIVSGMSGESEKKIREIFEEAKQHAPCILFIDEIDAITPKRETAQREMERRIVAQLLTCMDDVSLDKTDGKAVLVIGATNRPDSLDAALRRAGRFDREISMGVPDENARMRILEKLCSKLRLDGHFDFKKLAKQTPGYVGADLNALTSEAGMVAVRRIFKTLSHLAPNPSSDDTVAMEIDETTTTNDITKDPHAPPTPFSIITHFLSSRSTSLTPEDMESLSITYQDFLLALEKVQPSSKREGFATVPDVTWNDVGALGAIRDELKMSVVEPIKHPELFARVGITKPMGVLLYGPPGCGKTMLAKAVASESCCNFISVKGPELLNKFVGESERGVRMVFSRAASSAPCVIFFDELDALCPARSNDSESQSSSRLVNTLLTEMDGMNTRAQVYIIAATNRPDMIDPAMLRPGRLDKTLYVDLPTADERFEILKTITRKTPISRSVNLATVARDSRAEGFSGADLAALVREAAVAALRSSIYAKNVLKGGGEEEEALEGGKEESASVAESLFVTMEHFGVAFSRMAASVSKRDRRKYELLKVKFSGSGVAVPVADVEDA
ncbi:P-loop containing nucleoside triphosphate hydrolase protein [Obelidium mucronatum]|nr:P-loop containing nucleoside triphosphate hydrolase protein [Obelidium mucronatum]